MKKCPICKIATFLAGVGAINWLLVAFFGVDIVAAGLGGYTLGAKVVYSAIGISGLLLLISLFKACPCSGTESKKS